MKKLHLITILFAGLSLGASKASALEGFFLGAQLGHFSFTGESRGNFGNAIGFGVDLGFRTNGGVDLILGGQYSRHSTIGIIPGDCDVLAVPLTAEFHLGRAADFDFTIGAGPGFYYVDAGGANTAKFGINFGGAVDLLVDDNLKVGLGAKAHNIFSPTAAFSNYWTVTMRIGYLFS